MTLWNTEPKRPRPLHIDSILTLMSWAVGLTILLLTEWNSIPRVAQYVILGFIFLSFIVSLILGVIPATRTVKDWYLLFLTKRKKKEIIGQIHDLLKDGFKVFDINKSESLRRYVNQLSMNSVIIQNSTVYQQFRRLDSCLGILSDWNFSLVAFTNSQFKISESFDRQVQSIVSFYRKTSDVVRELCSIDLPVAPEIKNYDNDRRVMEAVYNQHIAKLEQILKSITEMDPHSYYGPFHRF